MLLAAIVGFLAVVVGGLLWLTRPVHHYAAHVRRQGWLSGVYAGHGPAPDESFAKWRGTAIQTATDFMGSGTWQQIGHPFLLSLAWRTDHALRLVLSVPEWPSSGGSLSEVASGTDDRYFHALGTTLVDEGRADTFIRLGWEFNTPFFRWQVKTPADAADYAEAWRHVVNAMRSVPGQHFQFVWNPDLADGGVDPALGYPGDSYVDDIGLDVYDRSQRPDETPAQRWDGLVHAKYGLQWVTQLASAHHKSLAFPEWGLVHDSDVQTAGEDDPLFIRNMHSWFESHNTAFEDYFDATSAHGAEFDLEGDAFPKAAATYRQLFGTG
ncbi:MAG TPA: glycosyl hydrolase [Mycobacteriales bacterium]|nr:glycosyl hydrolase [Mycobacteriales bacterium]